MAQLREMEIRYGPLTVGGGSAYLLDGFHRTDRKDGTSTSFVEFDIVVSSPTLGGFVEACRAVERVCRTPRLDLAVIQKGRTIVEACHSDARGGVNTEPEIRKSGDVGDTGRSRRYTIRVSYVSVADTVSTGGLLESSQDVSYDESRIRTIRIRGVFTGVSGTPSARARYEAAISAHVTAVLTALSVTTYELESEPVGDQDYDDRTLRFERVYRELVFGQGQDDPADDPDISKQSLQVSRREWSEERSPLGGSGNVDVPPQGGVIPGDSEDVEIVNGNVQALAVFDLHYEASVVATRTTDLKSKYDAYRQWLIGQFSARFGQGAFALTVERPQFDAVGNRFIVDMTAEGAVRGVDFVRRTVTTERSGETSKTFRGAWTGDDHDFYIYQGHARTLRSTTVTTRFLSTKDRAQAEEANEAAAAGIGGGGGGHVINTNTTSSVVRIGIEGSGHILDMVDVTSVVVSRIANDVTGGGGSSFGDPLTFGGPGGLPGALPERGGGSSANVYGLSGGIIGGGGGGE